MDIEKSIRQAVDTGKVVLGEKETLRAVQNKEVKLVIVSANCRPGSKESLEAHTKLSDIKVFDFEGSGVDLPERNFKSRKNSNGSKRISKSR